MPRQHVHRCGAALVRVILKGSQEPLIHRAVAERERSYGNQYLFLDPEVVCVRQVVQERLEGAGRLAGGQ